MKLSVSAWCLQEKLFANEIALSDFISYCQENGVGYVELLDCFLDAEKDIEHVNKLLSKLDMQVSAYSISNDFVHAEQEDRIKQRNYVKESMDTALKLGSKLLRVFSGNTKEGIAFEDAKEWIIECFRELAPLAEEKGVTMVLENHGLLAGKSHQIEEIIDRVGSKALRSNTDVGNFILVNEDPLHAVMKRKDRIGFIHLKDFKLVDSKDGYVALNGSIYQGSVLGEGDVPVAAIIDYLKEYGYQGFLSIEYEGPGDPFLGTAACIQYARNAIQSA